jgi:hypothetical protein
MAKKYFQGESGFKVLAGSNNALKTLFTKLKDYKLLLYLETEDGKITGIPRLKLVSGDIKIFQAIFKILSSNKLIKATLEKANNQGLFVLGNQKFRLYKSGGRLTNIIDNDGNMIGNKKPSTAQQEDAVRYILEVGSSGMPKKEAINKAAKFEFGKDWHDSFEKTYAGVLTIMNKSQLGQYNFYRDSNPKKAMFLNQLTNKKYLPDSKDNWNPSDIWAVKKASEGKLATAVDALHNKLKQRKAGIEDLNGFVEKVFDSKELIGISLKKVDSDKATVIKVEVGSDLAKKISFGGISSKFAYNVDGSYFDVLLKFKAYGDNILYRFRFRPRAASSQLKTYAEGQPQDAKVFDGAISSDLINRLFPEIQDWIKYCEKELKTMDNVYNTLVGQNKDKKFAQFIKAEKYSLLTVNGIKDKQADSYKIRRAGVLLYYIWHLEKITDKSQFVQMYMAAKKMNAFSSVHYKIS